MRRRTRVRWTDVRPLTTTSQTLGRSLSGGRRYAEKLTLKHAPEPRGFAPAAIPPPSWLAKADTTFIPRLLVLRSGSKSAGSPLPWSQTTISGPPGLAST